MLRVQLLNHRPVGSPPRRCPKPAMLFGTIRMTSSRTIIFLGAPSAKEAIKSWPKYMSFYEDHDDQDFSVLQPFKIDLLQKTNGVVWRRLNDPVESLSQELAETTMESHFPEDAQLERSFQIFTQHDNQLNDEDTESWTPSETEIPQVPFLTTYDFDVNEITELEELPLRNKIAGQGLRSYSLIVVITTLSALQVVTTRYGKSVSLVKLQVADQTKSNFEITCWDKIALRAQSMRINDIVYFQGKLRELFISLNFRCWNCRVQRSCVSNYSSTKPCDDTISMSENN